MPQVPTTSAAEIGLPPPQANPADYLMAAADLHFSGALKALTHGPQPYSQDAMPTASGGGRSIIELNNPKLGPSDVELREREKGFEQQRRRDRAR